MVHEILFSIGFFLLLFAGVQFVVNLFLMGFHIVGTSIISKEFKYSFKYWGFIGYFFVSFLFMKLSYNTELVDYLTKAFGG